MQPGSRLDPDNQFKQRKYDRCDKIWKKYYNGNNDKITKPV